MNRLLLFILLLTTIFGFGQNPTLQRVEEDPNRRINDTLNKGFGPSTSNKGLKNIDANIEMYKIISHLNDTTVVDTTLSVKKDYKFNYLRKDNFNFMQFSNIGQTYNTLSYDFNSSSVIPIFGARARHFNYMEIEDINYYYVPTPFTELMFKTAFEQGQLLDAFFTANTSKQLNFSIAYKGLRSLGKYQHILTSTGNFRFTTNYRTKNDKYYARAHIVFQDLMNEENGGIRDADIPNFESGNEDFLDRSVFDPNFEDAESILVGRRFHIDHHYNLISRKDLLSFSNLKVGNIVSYTDKYFRFEQYTPNEIFGDAFTNEIDDRTNLENFYVEANASYSDSQLGNIKASIGYTDFSYGYDKLVIVDGNTIENRINGTTISASGEYENTFNRLSLSGKVRANISGDFDGYLFNADANYKLNNDIVLGVSANSSSNAPNFNFLLNQSDYLNYNWQNNFENVKTNQLKFHVKSDRWANVDVDYSTIDNYTFFATNSDTLVKPFQSNGTINYFRIKLQKEFRYKNFALDNTLLYQTVIDGEGILNVPEFVTRNTLYYSNHFFRKALFLQTGVTFNYFSEYYMNAYDPVLAEFYTQNETKIGGFPRFDFFVNVKVQQTRIYFKLEHFNSAWTGYDYYSAPNYPYRDFVIRFGLVWNFFL